MPGGTAGATLRGSSNVRIGLASFQVRDGWIFSIQADPVIEIADQLLEQADPHFASVGDGVVTFHCENGDVSYGLQEHDDLRETWIGIRSDIDPDDLA